MTSGGHVSDRDPSPQEARQESRRKQVLAVLTAGDPDAPLVQRVCEVSASLLGVSGAGMCLVGGRSYQVVVHGTTELAEELEDLQLTLGQGPCMQAVRTGSPILVPDLAAHQTLAWPVFAEEALGQGVRALFSFPLESDMTTLGALDLYRDTPGPLTGPELIDALLLTGLAAQAMAAQQDRVHADGSVSALHWLATGRQSDTGPAGASGPRGEPITRGRAVDLGITVAEALRGRRPGTGSVALGDRPGIDRLPDLADHRRAALADLRRSLEAADEPSSTGAGTPRGGLVLVVHDEPGLRLVLGRALRRLGYRVLLADSVPAGIRRLADHPDLDAVIADVSMPTATGLDFAAAVIEHQPGVPILFLTAGPTATGALDDPLIGLVPKPVAIGDLRTQLAALIDRADRTTTSESTSDPTSDTPVERAVGDGGAVIGHRGRRIEAGGRLGTVPELDEETATWAAVAGFAAVTAPSDAGATGLSAVPGAGESARLASLGLFAAGVANEVNNMLAVVVMRADLLAEGEDGQPPTPAVLEDVASITEATARASGLVQQLMLFAGQRTLDRGTVDVAGLASDLQPRLDEVAGGTGIISYDLQPVPAVIGDHEHLERVLLNLVRNALEATTPDSGSDGPATGEQVAGSGSVEPRVRIRVGPTSSGPTAPGVVIEVADSGRGMSEEVRNRAVEPFFRAYTSAGGSGLGLAIVHGIVTQHGGRLDIDSTPGHGTTVRVSLPTEPVPALADRSA